jgi:hypothetical protein
MSTDGPCETGACTRSPSWLLKQPSRRFLLQSPLLNIKYGAALYHFDDEDLIIAFGADGTQPTQNWNIFLWNPTTGPAGSWTKVSHMSIGAGAENDSSKSTATSAPALISTFAVVEHPFFIAYRYGQSGFGLVDWAHPAARFRQPMRRFGNGACLTQIDQPSRVIRWEGSRQNVPCGTRLPFSAAE